MRRCPPGTPAAACLVVVACSGTLERPLHPAVTDSAITEVRDDTARSVTETTTATPSCPRLVAPADAPRVTPDLDGAALAAAVAAAPEGSTVVFAPGVYDLGGVPLRLDTPGVTLVSESGYPDDVLIDGGYRVETVLTITASDVHVGGLLFAHSTGTLIDVVPAGASITGLELVSLGLTDPGGVAMRFGTDGADHWVDGAELGCSRFELTSAGRSDVSRRSGGTCATGGLDVYGADAPWVHDVNVSGFWCANGTSGPAIHLRGGTRGALIERSFVLDGAQGVLIGEAETGSGRAAPEGACGEGAGALGVYGSVVRNLGVTLTDPNLESAEAGFVVGVGVEHACAVVLAHNTVYVAQPARRGDFVVGAGAEATLLNNLGTVPIVVDPAGVAVEAGNLVGTADWLTTDLHLRSDAPAVDAGQPLSAGTCADDRDGDLRDALPDVGADER